MVTSNSSNVKAIFKLIRPFQYYKNVLIFLGIIFSKQIDQTQYWIPLVLGFIALCAVSSLNYVINDIRDIDKDKLHPEKKNRPIASGIISKPFAIIIGIFLALITLISTILIPLSLIIRVEFLILLVFIFVTSQLYSFYFKRVVFLDVTFIAINYVWRAVSGCIIVQAAISPWLILIPFLFAMILALGKRKGDLILLQDNAKESFKYRKVLKDYNISIINQSLSAITAAMIVSYSFFTFEANSIVGSSTTDPIYNVYVALITIPFVSFILLRFLFLLENGDKVSRKAELLFLDKQIIIAGFIVSILLFASIFIDFYSIATWFQELPIFNE